MKEPHEIERTIAIVEKNNCFLQSTIPTKIIQHRSIVKDINATGIKDVIPNAHTAVQNTK